MIIYFKVYTCVWSLISSPYHVPATMYMYTHSKMLRVIEQSSIMIIFLFYIEYSVGAIYLIIQNLPRSMRYKRENVILVGLIPGPKETKINYEFFPTTFGTWT